MSKAFEEKLKSIFVQLVRSGLDIEKPTGDETCLSNLTGRYKLRMDFGNVSIFIPRLNKYEIASFLLINIGFGGAYVCPIKRKEGFL